MIDVIILLSDDDHMYGKLFGSMFEGSLVGKGWGPLLVMSYAVANGEPDREAGMLVELNPVLMAAQFGEDVEDVKRAIEFLCQPDPESRTPTEDGRRLIKLGTFSYQIVNGMKYRAIVDEDKRRDQVRAAMARHRAKKKEKPSRGATMMERMAGNGYDVSPKD